VSIIAKVPPVVSIPDLEAETGVYSATPGFVRDHCGPVANGILDAVPGWYFQEAADLGLYPNIDVRIHRLYPGDYPAYPGLHCDGEYRETYFSQPDLNRIPVSRHVVATVSSDPQGISNTRFVARAYEFTPPTTPSSDHTLWGQAHQALSAIDDLPYWDTRDGEVVCFDARTMHAAMPATLRGWRLFFRLSMWHKPNLGPGGMVTRQEQIYKVAVGSGW
jgi:hypothetical protein